MMRKGSVDPHLFVVFGGTGDLMRRKLLPSLYHLDRDGRLGPRFKVLALARDESITDQSFRAWAREALRGAELRDPDSLDQWCNACLHYQATPRSDKSTFERLRDRVISLDAEHDLGGNRTFYLALPPGAFAPTASMLGAVGLAHSAGQTRLVVEKPFGRDLASARDLNRVLHQHFDESQIYRIDHYLGKETVQNLMVFRFANPVFESLWHRDRIESVEITVAESLGVGSRGRYYDRAGALRDMIQNHLTQLITLAAMEVPASLEADAIRDEKVKVLHSAVPPQPDDAVFAQYATAFLDGQPVPGYLEEENVDGDSHTETFAAVRLHIDNWRWSGVPFYIRTGKRMKERCSRIVVRFRRPPVALFRDFDACELNSNTLVLTLQPGEGFALYFDVKTPGEAISVRQNRLHFAYAEAFGPIPDGYETLLYDIVTNDQTLFVRSDEVEASWRLYEPLLTLEHPVRTYAAGTWGPTESDLLLAEMGHRWAAL